MVVMSEEKVDSGNLKDASKKVCPRASKENAKKKPETKSWKTAHTGLRFHFDRKKLVTHEFSFNSVSKTEKVTRSRSGEKSVETQNVKTSSTSGSKEIKVLMDTLKISKSEECCSREKSPLRKETPKSPVVERLTSKKVCTRCTRCSKSPKEDKPEIKPLKVTKNQEQPLKSIKKENSAKTCKLETPLSPKTVKKEHHSVKAVKIETPPSPKTTTCKKQCSKLAKLLAEPQEKILKPKSILINAEKSPSRIEKNDEVNCESTPNAEKPKLSFADKGRSKCANEEKSEPGRPTSGKPENLTSIPETSNTDVSDKESSEIPNGSVLSSAPDTKACLLNGTRHDEHICDPHLGLDSPDGTRRDLEPMKSASKIPRKTHGATGMKSEANLNKGTIPQPVSFELGSQNINEQPDAVNVVN